ncbi:isopentenyl-diphosphate delta-isomerase [Escherichia coli]|nr:isopentenyl-diphosphate delta-isomerase [Escherichia coli]CTV58033.1 isopentenyl-diphosphate delta-isomerase [Escherichia coli]CTY42414.1 isopentenyl-diphosphate delta-isomerase [Escherichia coli]CTY59512.1 isopentenyl-diphosphate delta-isomerase [Escherichia coli]
MMSLWDALRMNMMISYQELVRTFPSALQINDDEVMDYQWCDLADVLHGIDATPWAFSPWMVMQATNREARKRLSAFTQLK